jgi:hypothetical protein
MLEPLRIRDCTLLWVASLAYAQHGNLRRPIVAAFVGWGGSILAIGLYGLSTRVGELLALGLVAGGRNGARQCGVGDADAPSRPARCSDASRASTGWSRCR